MEIILEDHPMLLLLLIIILFNYNFYIDNLFLYYLNFLRLGIIKYKTNLFF